MACRPLEPAQVLDDGIEVLLVAARVDRIAAANADDVARLDAARRRSVRSRASRASPRSINAASSSVQWESSS